MRDFAEGFVWHRAIGKIRQPTMTVGRFQYLPDEYDLVMNRAADGGLLSLPRLPFRHTRTQARMCMLGWVETRGAALSLRSAARVDAAVRSADR
jgi:hypothetical protein